MVDRTHYKNLERSGSIRRKKVNPDLLAERDKLAFSKDDVEACIFDLEAIAQFKRWSKYFKKHPAMMINHEFFDMTREEQMRCRWDNLALKYKVNREVFFE